MNIAAIAVLLKVTKNWITVIQRDLLSDFHLNSISSQVISKKEFTPPLVPIMIAARFFSVIAKTSPSEINAPAMGDHDIVTSVIKYERKKDLIGLLKKLLRNSILIQLIKLYLRISKPTKSTSKAQQIERILRVRRSIFSFVILIFGCFLVTLTFRCLRMFFLVFLNNLLMIGYWSSRLFLSICVLYVFCKYYGIFFFCIEKFFFDACDTCENFWIITVTDILLLLFG